MKWFGLCIGLLFGYIILRFGMVSRGRLRQYIQFIGGLLLTSFFVVSFFIVGWVKGLINVAIFWFVITPIVEIIIRQIDKRINAPYTEVHKHLAEKYNSTSEEVKKKIYEQMDKID